MRYPSYDPDSPDLDPQVMIANLLATNPRASDEEIARLVTPGLLKNLPPMRPMTPQDYIEMQFQQLQNPQED